MIYKIRISKKARHQISSAKRWYDARQAGLGTEFTSEIRRHIELLKSPAVEHKPAFKNVRRDLVQRFPFVIYYERNEEEMVITIISVLHNRQQQSAFD
jgi:plasmid stabilization system protein ParE